jgi:hypothetical protein
VAKVKGLVEGVGVCDKGSHLASVGTKNTKMYKMWHRMFIRCYSEEVARRKNYEDCTVDSRFHKFQSFATWAVTQVGSNEVGWHIDKDLLLKGSRMYSPDTCVFLPPSINTFIGSRRRFQSGSSNRSQGVYYDKRYASYYSSLKDDEGVLRRLGTFTTEDGAFGAYKAAKELKARRLAKMFELRLDPRAVVALGHYEVTPNG